MDTVKFLYMDYVKKLCGVCIFLLGTGTGTGTGTGMGVPMPVPILDSIITFTLMMASIAITVYDH